VKIVTVIDEFMVSKKDGGVMSKPVTIAFETNGTGYMGFLCEYPGAFVRGKTVDEALSKVEREVKIYQKWCGIEIENDIVPEVVQLHKSPLNQYLPVLWLIPCII